MSYRNPVRVMALFLEGWKSDLGIDDVIPEDSNRVPTAERVGVIVNATPSGGGYGSAAQSYVSNLLIYCPDTVIGTKTTRDGIDRAFALAGLIEYLFRGEEMVVVESDLLIVNPTCTAPSKIDDPISGLAVVTMSVEYALVQGA